MPIDPSLLADARAARQALFDAQADADRAMVSFQHAVRKLHGAGATMREIAEALEMSHQRVHQIVDIGAGKGAIRGWRAGKQLLSCRFCGRSQAEVAKLIAGPNKVSICDECVDSAMDAIAAKAEASTGHTTVAPARSGASCSFCGKTTKAAEHVVAGPFDVNICNECLDLCVTILIEEGDRPARR